MVVRCRVCRGVGRWCIGLGTPLSGSTGDTEPVGGGSAGEGCCENRVGAGVLECVAGHLHSQVSVA